MNWVLLLEQTLNGLQLGVLLFLLAAGLTLIFGIMDLINLAHGSLYMMGAYFAATFTNWTESFFIGLLLTLPACMLFGMLLEIMIDNLNNYINYLQKFNITQKIFQNIL